MKSRAGVAALAMGLLASSTSGRNEGERGRARAWVEAAFLRQAGATTPPPGLEVRRQDHGRFRLRRSVLDTPLRLGKRTYAHGLGTHSVSEIVVRLPRPGRRFEAEAGVDNNPDTRGQKGSVVLVVEVGGREAFRSGVRRGSDGPLPVRVELGGARQFTLRVLDAGDGPGWDQTDWAEASVMLDNGERIWLDEMNVVGRRLGLSHALPFSFVYGGRPAADLLPSWTRAHRQGARKAGRERHVVTWTEPDGGLEVQAEVTLFEELPAVDSVLRFRNTGKGDTAILERVLPLDLGVGVPETGRVVFHHAHGSTCSATDFLPVAHEVAPNATVQRAPNGGRSSDGWLPFFNLQWPGGGVAGAIGWSGQWALRLHRKADGWLTLQAGQQTTHLRLRPGEAVRTPRILVVLWEGEEPLRGHNLLRRVLLAHYVPRRNGQVVVPLVTQNTWFTFQSGNAVTEANQLAAIERMAPLGVEAYWLDAGWFEGGWPSGVGNWVPKADAFPRGLAPLGRAAHAAGMKFVLWFEPERVHPSSRIAREHPEWVLRTGGGDGLFNLGEPAARKWLADHLSRCIAEWGVDVYRNDFNIAPLPFWRAADAPDRQGLAEIRYVEGLYALWDELLSRHPGLAIDNCSSGGRRIDLETLSRSVPLWRSDTQCCGRALPVQDQVQTAGLSLYVPLHAAGCWGVEPYLLRSVATTGTNLCMDTRSDAFPAALAQAAIAEVKALRPLLLGDFHPLLPITLDEGHWAGWQFHRADLGRGVAFLFRRARSPYAVAEVALRGLHPEARYTLTFAEDYEPKATRTTSGAELARLRVEIARAPGSLRISYQRADGSAAPGE